MKKYVLRIETAESVLGHLAGKGMSKQMLDKAFANFVAELCDALEMCASEKVIVEKHLFTELEAAKAKLLEPGLPYICLDSQSKLGVPFGVSRHFDFVSRKQLGITSRPGCDDLDEQIDLLKQMHAKTIGIIEDDIFTGGTLKQLIAQFGRRGIMVKTIVSGIASTSIIDTVPVAAVAYYDPRKLFELTDPRDYIFGAKHGGLVVTYQHVKARVPYDASFVDITARSSINPVKVEQFTTAVRQANYRLHKTLGSLGYPAALFYPENMLHAAGFPGACTLGELLTSSVPVA